MSGQKRVDGRIRLGIEHEEVVGWGVFARVGGQMGVVSRVSGRMGELAE